MARVKGIIAAGLSSASTGIASNLHDQATRRGQDEAERNARVNERVSRRRSVDESSQLTDDAGSLLAGIGTAAVFGGPAGLLLFGVSKLMSDRKRQGIAAYRQYVSETAEDRIAATERALDALSAQAETDGERAAVELKRAQWELLKADAESLDPEISARAILAGQDLVGTLDDEFDDWESERLEAEKVSREIEQQLFDRASNLDGRLQRESARYLAANETWQKAQLMYERPTPQSDMALVYLTAQMIDPGAIVTDGDSKMIKATGTLSQQMAGYLNSLIDGTAGFDDAVRDGLMSVIAENYLPMRREQMERNAMFQEIGQEAGLEGTAYQKKLQIKIDPTEAGRIAEFRRFNPSQAGIPTGNPDDYSPLEESGPASIVGDIVRGVEGFAGDVSKTLKGERQLIDGDGNIVIEDADGNRRNAGYADRFINRDGDEIVRIDGPNGPIFRNVTKEQRMRRDAQYNRAGLAGAERGSVRIFNE